MSQRIRTWVVASCLYLAFGAVVVRLFYWQVIKSDSLQAAAQNQYQKKMAFTGERGTITTSDGYTLVGNETVYRLYANPQDITNSDQLAADLAPKLAAYYLAEAKKIPPEQPQETELSELVESEFEATESAEILDQQSEAASEDEPPTQTAAETAEELETLEADLKVSLQQKLSDTEKKWVSLAPKISQALKMELEAYLHEKKVTGVGFDPYTIRSYPESSMAAQLVGFVGKDSLGEDIGYFGLEGALNNELKKRSLLTSIDGGTLGFGLFSLGNQLHGIDGRDITLSLRRDIQFLLESELAWGIEHYGAKSGEAIVMNPQTGKILGLASAPSYHPRYFYQYNQELFQNPAVSNLYEPGSTLKPLTVAAGLDQGVITPETQCPICSEPIQVGQYQIKTWNNQYTPNIRMIDALANSDNVAMVYIARQVGEATFKNYLEKFGIGDQTTDELQEDRDTPFPAKWGPVELATRSFGQGISMTSLQLLRAIGTIANHGLMMQPSVLESMYDPVTESVIPIAPQAVRQVISPEAARETTRMMVYSVEQGEAKWTASRTHTLAAKTGTAQIPVEGGYDPDRTITNYVGFAPADNPQYVMLVKLVEPSTSIWAAETAAPLWHRIAKKLHLLLAIQPDKNV